MPPEQIVACQKGASPLGPMLEQCRQYLLLVANRELGPELRAKTGASDMVQETFLSAGRCFRDFRGSNEADLLAWLRRILLNQIATLRRQFHGTQKRCVGRELALDDSRLKDIGRQLTASGDSPSRHAIRGEEVSVVERAVADLAPRYALVIRLRHFEQLSFEQAGSRLGLSAQGARQLWARAIQKLQRELMTAGPR